MSDEKNVELGVFEALNALAEEKNASVETRETLRKNVRESSEAQQGAERRRPGRPKKEKAPEVPLDEAIAAGLTNLRNAKAKHAPAPKVAAPVASETEVASTLDSLFAAAEKKAAEPAVEEKTAKVETVEKTAKVEEVAKVEKVAKTETVEKTAKVETVEKTAKVEEVVAPAAESAEPAAEPVAESAVEVKEETAKVEVVTPAKAEKTEATAEAAEQKAEEPAAEQPAEATAVAEESATEEPATEAPAAEESAEEPEVAPEPVKTISDLQREKLQELRSRTPMGAMPLFMAPEPEELSELAVAAKLEREARRAAAEEQKRKERMERRREEAAAEAEVTSHRRRRRRRGTEDIEIEGGVDDDVETVTKVRAPRLADSHASNTVTGVRGSTRLEAKRVRRRESRSLGRRRHIVTEAEFLARRESVDRQMLVRQKDGRIQIGVLEDGVLAEHFVSKTQQDSLIGNVYLGKVQNVLPSMEAAFVDIGRGRNAVLYAGEVNWDVTGLDGAPRKIENALKPGDSVLVQVTKDPIGHKGARLTSQVSLPGRFLVYVPGGSMTGISRKLPDTERARLKKILKDKLPEGAGVIVRTAAEGASEEELTHDINRLRAQWEEIQEKANSRKVLAPEMLYQEPDLMIKTVRDVFNEDFTAMIVQGENAWDSIEAYVTYVAPDLVSRLQQWDGEDDLFDHYRINEQLAKALDRKVYLPSGGSLVIDRTEAMTVVDVNTGKFTGSGGNLEETVTKNNLEAAEEIVRQLRLRDIGGIIVIDFIDMVLESNRDLVLRRLIECLGRDRTKHQVAEVTSLGLVQMTRKRLGTGLLEVFSEPCEQCAGRGLIVHDQPLSGRSGGASDYIHRHERNDRKRARAAAREDSRDQQKQDALESKKAERRNAMAAVAAASAQADEASEETTSTRKKRKRRKRSRRAETAELSLEQEIQGIAEAASEQAHAEVAQREDKVAEVTGGNWIGEQGGFSLEQLASAFDRVEESAEDSSNGSDQERSEDRSEERRSSKRGEKKSTRNRQRRELTNADIAAVEDSGAGSLEDEHHVDPELDPRFSRSSDRFEAIRAGEAKARASQKAGRLARTEGESFRSGREDRSEERRSSKRQNAEQQNAEATSAEVNSGVQKAQESKRVEREDLRIEDVRETPRASRRRARRAADEKRAEQAAEQASAKADKVEKSEPRTVVTGVIGAPAVTGVVGAAPVAVEAEAPVEDQKPAAQVPGSTPRKRRTRRAASSAGAGAQVVTVDASERAEGSVVASASVADVAPVADDASAPVLFGIGVAAADIKREGKDD
ncbi:Rne/Rng family ribonuclease [Rothia sp. (in: high G+C Gram-positive bacteria)]|uniref:Rne/Rng family ribonuclease n=1 Tax=Rothia sp. (in: high G+C Gram-positive bacteria) TaxID=1885016 RepID=UPI001CB5610E|nr:Rne/Rng family ribonuclease [Rothia sp. (in: high G+C Gram-positive bacteria)]MBF1668603.1 Rne/Rng family ribonuclease [Rothia sp. (in: high G+C Gram-positive bacteria)]